MATKRIVGLMLFLISIVVIACIESFDIKGSLSGNMLVVEAVISNQLKRHQVLLTRATSVSDRRIVYELGATVSISDQNGTTISLTEEMPGIYLTPEFAAEPGKSYVLRIRTSDGHEYESQVVSYKDGADIGDVYAKYVANPTGEGKGIQIYLDTEDPQNQTRFYRWSYVETYQVNAPFPSNWVWLGGNEVTFRHDGIDTCYVTDTLRNILVKSTKELDRDKIVGQPIRFIPEKSYIMRFRYSILVTQFALSQEAYLFWDHLKKISEEQGSLSDMQPGSLSGNIIPLTNPNESVLGYFEACRESEKRIVLSPIDFYYDGFKRPANFRNYCYEVEPIFVNVSKLGETMERYQDKMYIWEAFGMGESTTFELMPRPCCDCRDQGTTVRPPFF